MVALLVLAAAVAGAAVFVALEAVARPRREAVDPRRRLDPYVRRSSPAASPSRRSGRAGAFLAGLNRRLRPRRSEIALGEQLAAAGLGGRLSTQDFLALELLSAAVAAALGALLGLGHGAGTALLLILALGGAGLLLPRYLVRSRARARAERIRAELPDVLDLLAVTVRAGLGLDAAIARVTEMSHGPLVEELALVLHETRIGDSRTRALERMAARLDTREVTTFVRALVQAEQLGTSVAETLGVQAVEARRRRSAVSEERANKASVKMIFPTVLFIFPALFVVILAPAALTFMGGL